MSSGSTLVGLLKIYLRATSAVMVTMIKTHSHFAVLPVKSLMVSIAFSIFLIVYIRLRSGFCPGAETDLRLVAS